jgi:hypothetical protein
VINKTNDIAQKPKNWIDQKGREINDGFIHLCNEIGMMWASSNTTSRSRSLTAVAERPGNEVRHLRPCWYRRSVPRAWLLRLFVRPPSRLPNQVRWLPRVTKGLPPNKGRRSNAAAFYVTIQLDSSSLDPCCTIPTCADGGQLKRTAPCVPNPVTGPHSAEKSTVLASHDLDCSRSSPA